MSDDEDDTSGDFAMGTPSGLGNLFSQDRRRGQEGNGTFKWKPPEKKKTSFAPSASIAEAAMAHNVGEDLILDSAMVRLFQDQNLVGASMCYVRAMPQKGQAPYVCLLFADQQKKKLLETSLLPSTYWVQQPYEGQQQYVNLQDGSGVMWSLQFRKPEEATAFTQMIYSIQYSLSLFDAASPATSSFEVMGGTDEPVAYGDMVGVRFQTYRLQNHEKCPTLLVPVQPVHESTPDGDTKKVKLSSSGSKGITRGMHDSIVGMSKGQRRYIVLRDEEMTICDTGMRGPGVSETDLLMSHIEVVKVKTAKAEAPPPAAAPVEAAQSAASLAAASHASLHSHAVSNHALVVVDQPATPNPFAQSAADLGQSAASLHQSAASLHQSTASMQPQPTAAAVPAAAVPPVAAVPVAAAAAPQPAAALDTNALLTTLLVKQLGGAAAAPAEEAKGDLGEMQKGMDRLMVQMGQLYQKIDHIDVTRKLDENNEKIENVFRRVLGKAPSRGYDPLQSGLDRECEDIPTLLAEVEKREKRITELTESYHNALTTISEGKEELSAVKTDLTIERQTALDRVGEAGERHRLVVVEMDAKHRNEMEQNLQKAKREGYDEGYKMGVVEGEREAFLKQAGGSMDELVDQLQAAREENTNIQSEMLGLNQKLLDERKQHDEQISLMNTLVKKYEERETTAEAASASKPTGANAGRDEAGTLLIRSLKSIMNSLYFKLEEEVMPEGADAEAPIPASQVLQMATKVIKVCTKQSLASLKQELDLAGPKPLPGAPAYEPPPPPSEGSAALPDSSALPSLPTASADPPPPPPV